MNQSLDSMALGLGAFITAVTVIVGLALYWTHDLAPVERRARRLGMLAAVLFAALVPMAEVALYRYNTTLGMFMAIPTALLTVAAFLLGGYWTYRALGGGKQEEVTRQVPVEPQTLERQSEIWCQLRDLPQFRETLGGDLINLLTGDRLYWITHLGERCIEINLGGKTPVIGSRCETLTKYLAVQTGLARALLGRAEAPSAAPGA